jgi:hypothetical protein
VSEAEGSGETFECVFCGGTFDEYERCDGPKGPACERCANRENARILEGTDP